VIRALSKTLDTLLRKVLSETASQSIVVFSLLFPIIYLLVGQTEEDEQSSYAPTISPYQPPTSRRHARHNPLSRDHGAPNPPRKGGALPHRRSERLLQDVVRVRFAPGRGPEDKAEGHAGVWQAFARSGAGGAGREDVFVIWYV
jgi:hypothetical protein